MGHPVALERFRDACGGRVRLLPNRDRLFASELAHAARQEPRPPKRLLPPTHSETALKRTGGQAGDCSQLPELIAGVPTEAVIADKAYDSNDNRAAIARQGAVAVIPPKKTHLKKRV